MKTIQLEHKEVKNQLKKFPIRVVCDDINSAENVGMIFRISEAMGVEHIYLCGDTICPPNKKLMRTARSTEKALPYSYLENAESAIQELKEKKHTIVALEITNTSKEISQINFAELPGIAIVIGNESKGISEELLNISDLSAEIKMFGINSSMNVVNALSIALYEVTRQMRT